MVEWGPQALLISAGSVMVSFHPSLPVLVFILLPGTDAGPGTYAHYQWPSGSLPSPDMRVDHVCE